MALLDGDEKKRIEAAIAALEQRSASEVVVATVARSEDHTGPRMLASVLGACLVALICSVIWSGLETVDVLFVQLPVAYLLYLLSGQPALLRLVVPSARLSEAAEDRASRMFLERGIFETRDRTGVLILVSELERRAVILGDKGIHERVQIEGWKKHVDAITRAVAEGRAAEGIVQVIEAVGEVLGERVPVREDDTDELSNEVVTE